MRILSPRAQQTQPDTRRRSPSALFLAGLPERSGPVLTRASRLDSWRHKHPAIERRLQQERLERLGQKA